MAMASALLNQVSRSWLMNERNDEIGTLFGSIMDPFSLAASVITVIQLSERVISLCKWYVTSMRDAPKDLRTIMMEAGSVKPVLTNLEFFMSTWATSDMLDILRGLEGPEGPIEGCRKALVALEKLFPSGVACNTTDTKRRATTISYAKLAWPFKEEKARKILEDIVRYKATISLALTTDTAHDTKNIKAKVERLCDALDSQTREKALKWLVKTDPSVNHNAACELHDSHTGTWVNRLPQYEDWKNGLTRFLWFHGIPGAGKTVLLSYIIEDIKKYCSTIPSDDVTYSYYYCYFGRNQDEVPHLLRWVINQLCRKSQYVPNEMLDCFKVGEQPSVPVLIEALKTVLRNFRRVYVVLDALDESQERQNLLRLLKQLAGDSFEKIGLLAMSRKEIDIEISLEPISTHMSLSNPHVDEDIRIYVTNQLQTHHRLCTWPKSLSAEIREALVKGAKGMFRWAACQIDILGRLHTPSEIREALNELPETLDETYERILLKIPVKKRKIAHKVLHLLAFNIGHSISDDSYALAEAVIVDVEQLSFKPEYRFLDRNALFEICTCLITHTASGQVNLAHYSVKEYLISKRIQHSPAAAFKISLVAHNALFIKTCLVYLLDITYDGLRSFKDYEPRVYPCQDYWPEFPFLFSALDWFRHINSQNGRLVEEVDKVIIDGLVERLLNPNGSHYQGWLETAQIREIHYSTGLFFPRWKTGPGPNPSLNLAYACFFGQLESAKKILDSNPGLATAEKQLEFDMENTFNRTGRDLPRTAVEIAIIRSYSDIVELLFDRGADPNGVNAGGDCQLLYILKSRERPTSLGCSTTSLGFGGTALCNIMQVTLKAGADPNLRGGAFTPLQVATIRHDYIVVEQLLKAGARVNAVGDDEAVAAAIKRDCSSGVDFFSQADIDEGVRTRGILPYYQTPVRIVEKHRIQEEDAVRIRRLLSLLRSYGGKSLNLFPIKDLPGYEEADFHALSENGVEQVEELL